MWDKREIFLQKLREYGKQNTIPNISDCNAKLIRDLLFISKTKKMLEIGTANWFSAIHFACELEKLWWELVTIDFSEKSYLEAIDNFAQAGVEQIITPILGNALDEIPNLEDNSFDFVFIDGMMRRTVDFLQLSWPKIKMGWIIIIDDVIKFRHKMTGFYEYLEEADIAYNVLPIDEDDGIMMIIKK